MNVSVLGRLKIRQEDDIKFTKNMKLANWLPTI